MDLPEVVTANGTYDLPCQEGKQHLLTWKGTIGTAILSLGMINKAGNFDAFDGGQWTVSSTETEVRFWKPRGRKVVFVVAAADGTLLLDTTFTPLG